jgi:molybdopterin molybdotransferase
MMKSVEQALAAILGSLSTRRKTVMVSLGDSSGLVLAADVRSDTDMPPFDKSAMDGFAVTTAGFGRIPARLSIVEDIPAGSVPKKKVIRGTCSRIMTGAPLPRGADAVVMVEETRDVSAHYIEILVKPARCQNVCFKGEDIRKGAVVLRAGTVIRPQEAGVLASVGCAKVPVFRTPSAAILTTGSELVPIESKPSRGRIRDSNAYSLAAQFAQAGVAADYLGIAPDDRYATRRMVRKALSFDIAVLTGGVSVGKYDFVEECLRDEGVRVLFDAVRMKPGKPFTFGTRKGTLVFALPGNPVSTFVVFELFIRAAVERMCGRQEASLRTVRAKLETPHSKVSERTQFIPAMLREDRDGRVARPVEWHGSADIMGLTKANSLIVVPPSAGPFGKGSAVNVLLLD